MRKRLFEIIELSNENDAASKAYDLIMMCTIVASLIPLAFKETNFIFTAVDYTAAAIFIIDYLLRFITADYKLGEGGKITKNDSCRISANPFICYPFTPMAIVDLLAILPVFNVAASGFKLFKLFRLLRTFRIFKIARYSKSIIIISNVVRKQKEPLMAVGVLAVAYILICALIIFNVEPDTFENFFEAIYWATISLTTMGYGDIYPTTTIGRIVTDVVP